MLIDWSGAPSPITSVCQDATVEESNDLRIQDIPSPFFRVQDTLPGDPVLSRDYPIIPSRKPNRRILRCELYEHLYVSFCGILY